MDKLLNSVQEYIKSGEYFSDARQWYNFKYLYPVVQRSYMIVCTIVLAITLLIIVLNFETLLPIVREVRYTIAAKSLKTAKIINANQVKGDALSSIVDIMIKDYVVHRESYNYALLRPQFIFIQNNSTRIIFRQFSNFMNIDNPSSPVMRYQRDLKRKVDIRSAVYHKNNEAEVTFNSIVKSANDVVEDMIWKAKIDYEVDPINIHLPPNSQFNFAVTGYKVTLIKDRSKR